MSPSDAMILMLLAAHFLALGVAVVAFVWIVLLQRRNRTSQNLPLSRKHLFPLHATGAVRPPSWLAVRSMEPETVRTALASQTDFSISARVNGWVIVTGPGLPDPSDDVDDSFRFLTFVSRRLGHVQFFQMDKISGNHSWARLDEGCVTRAYAWAGETIWTQGDQTQSERQLGMNCYDYGECSEAGSWTMIESAMENMEKIPLLAARWSLDPEILYRTEDSQGESSPFY